MKVAQGKCDQHCLLPHSPEDRAGSSGLPSLDQWTKGRGDRPALCPDVVVKLKFILYKFNLVNDQ